MDGTRADLIGRCLISRFSATTAWSPPEPGSLTNVTKRYDTELRIRHGQVVGAMVRAGRHFRRAGGAPIARKVQFSWGDTPQLQNLDQNSL